MSILQDPARVIRGSLPKDGRTLVISDIHANKTLLDRLLRQAEYRPGEDRLILLGDFLLKGKENLATLRRVMELASIPGVTVLRGNCDDILEIIARNYPSGGMENFLRRSGFCREVWQEAGMDTWDHLSAEELLAKLDETIPEELAFIHSLPDILETEHFIFVHGGIYDGRQQAFEQLDSFDCRKCDRFLEQNYTFDKYVVTGHWPVTSYPRALADHCPLVDKAQKIISIDGGCSVQWGAQLNALVIENGRPEGMHWFFVDVLPRVRALAAQAERFSAKRMYWECDTVEVLAQQGDLCRVRQQGTEEIFNCPTALLWQDGAGNTHTGDLSEYVPAVEAGQEIGVIARGEGWIYGKVNGIEGWYYGPVAEV